jgi:predicted RNA-binding protein associated with RNAse of E/G family
MATSAYHVLESSKTLTIKEYVDDGGRYHQYYLSVGKSKYIEGATCITLPMHAGVPFFPKSFKKWLEDNTHYVTLKDNWNGAVTAVLLFDEDMLALKLKYGLVS